MNRAFERARVGIFGGTFNPIHVGHLRAAEEVAEALELQRVLFVPAARPPHKTPIDDDRLAPAARRLEWVSLAIAGNPRFEVEPIEIEREGASYLVDTLTALGERLQPERPVFILGQDAFAEIETWREPAKLLALAHFAVMTRPPGDPASLRDWLPDELAAEFRVARDGRSAIHRSAGTWLRVVEITALDVSASELRRRLREGRSVRYLIPDAVREAVARSGVYTGGKGGAKA